MRRAGVVFTITMAILSFVPGLAGQTAAFQDLEILSIETPMQKAWDCAAPGGLQVVSVRLKSNGNLIASPPLVVPIEYRLNAGAPVIEMLTTDLDFGPSAEMTFSFATPSSFPVMGINSLLCRVYLLGDANPANDLKFVTFGSQSGATALALPFSESFDGLGTGLSTILPPLWTQDPADGSGATADWYAFSGATPTPGTGPQGDHTSGNGGYLYLEDSASEHAEVNLISPCIDLTTAQNPVLGFWLHSRNSAADPRSFENHLAVDVIPFPSGVPVLDLLGPLGHEDGRGLTSSGGWWQHSLDLGAFVGQTVQIRFRGRSDNGGEGHDIAIDDIRIEDPLPTPGQAPQPGLAVLDINRATHVTGLPVTPGLNGPYSADVTQQGVMNIAIEGAPLQFMFLLLGNLNPASATYRGGIGQFDIGGPGVTWNGLPTNLVVFVNSVAWAQSGFVGYPISAFFVTDQAGDFFISLPAGFVDFSALSFTMQAAITVPWAPFIHLSNAVTLL